MTDNADYDSATVWFNTAVGYTKQGKLDLAIEAYQRAIAINPNQAATHNNLGLLYIQKGELFKATQAYQQAVLI